MKGGYVFLSLIVWLIPWGVSKTYVGHNLVGEIPFAEAKDTFSILCKNDKANFSQGEILKYNAYYKWSFMWFKVGEVTFKIQDNPYSYTLTAQSTSYSAYSWLFPVNDYYKTVLSKEDLRPLISIRSLEEGGYRLYEHIEFDWVSGKARVSRGKTKENTVTTIEDVSECARDLLSLPFYLRSQDYTSLQIGDVVPFYLFLNKKNYNLALKYEQIETKKIRGVGDFRTQKYSAHMLAGTTFGEKGAVMNAYVSDDRNKVPIYLESDVYVGSVKLIIEEAQNLKYPFTAKISDK